jgi:hypothetical protein
VDLGIRFGQQGLDGGFGRRVPAFSDAGVAQMAALIDQVNGRPVLSAVGVAGRPVIVLGDRIRYVPICRLQ